jgi:AmmeMemoRadiSam system protein B
MVGNPFAPFLSSAVPWLPGMDSTFTRPKLRWPLDIRMHNLGGQDALVIQCPIGISAAPLALMPQFAPVIVELDGVQTSERIVAKFAPQGLTPEILRELITRLDDHLFMANARYFAAEKLAKDAFTTAPVRAPALAGAAYPATREELAGMVRGYLKDFETPEITRDVACLIAPHIDYRRGGACYGAIYPRLMESRADTYILVGTAHQYSRRIFHLCAKDFQTPLGAHPCDQNFVTQLANRFGVDRAFADQYLHRREHSLELQLPFLSAVQPDAPVVPILVGSYHQMLEAMRYPQEWEEYETFAGALTEIIKERAKHGEKISFLAGVDMAHVGRSFGDEGSLSPERMREIRYRDQQYLRAIEECNPKALFDHIAEDHDARRICGFPTMYLVLDVLNRLGDRIEVDVVAYDQAVDYPSDCAVTFAGAAMYRRAPLR